MDIKSSTPLTDANQASQANNKYKKALKEINRLIAINTSVKKELIALQEQYDRLRNEYSSLQQKYNALSEQPDENTDNQNLLNIVKNDPKLLQAIVQTQEEKGKANIGSSQIRQMQSSPYSYRGKELENTGTLSQYMDTKRKLEKVEERLQEKQKQILSLTANLASKAKENSELYQKQIQLENNISKLKNQLKIGSNSIEDQLSKEKVDMENQLLKYKELSQKLLKDIEIIKKNSMPNLGSSYQSLISNVKSHEPIRSMNSPVFSAFGTPQTRPAFVPYHQSFYTSATQSLQNSAQKAEGEYERHIGDPFSEYYFKKVRDLQLQIHKIKKQNSSKKSKYKNEISKLKQQLQSKQTYIQQINHFMQKQQSFIESFYVKDSEQKTKAIPTKMVSSQIQLQKVGSMNSENAYPKSYENIKDFGKKVQSINSLNSGGMTANKMVESSMQRNAMIYEYGNPKEKLKYARQAKFYKN